jgi:hypothetical protein
VADKKSIERALRAIDRLCIDTAGGRFYIHINWKYCLIFIHREDSPELNHYAENDEIPESPGKVFGETSNGFWKGYFESYTEALGYSKLINDVHHKQTGQYLLVADSGGVIAPKTARAVSPHYL